MPRQIWRSAWNRITPPSEWQDLAGQNAMRNGQSTTFPPNTWLISTTEGNLFIVGKGHGYWQVDSTTS